MDDKDKSIITHLEELRQTLIRCFYSVALMLPLSLWLSPKCLNMLIRYLIRGQDISLNYFSPMGVFILQLKLALLMSVMLAFPYIAKNLWDFVLPALYDKERLFLKKAVLYSSTLFICGILFCWLAILPLIINFGMGFSTEEIRPVFEVNNVINLALWLSFTFGIMFQVPLITNILVKWGIASRTSISEKRPYVIVVLLTISALLTPPDVISQIMLFLPTYMLFEAGLYFSRKA